MKRLLRVVLPVCMFVLASCGKEIPVTYYSTTASSPIEDINMASQTLVVPATSISTTAASTTDASTMEASTTTAPTTEVRRNEDNTPPMMEYLRLSAEFAPAPGTIEVTIKASDDNSGIKWGQVGFYNPSRNKQYYGQIVLGDDNLYHGIIELDQYAESGVYTLWEILIEDNAGNKLDLYDANIPLNLYLTFEVIN